MIKAATFAHVALPVLIGSRIKWRLTDSHTQYGDAGDACPYGPSQPDQQQLVDTLVEQLTATLALDRHQERQRQLIVVRKSVPPLPRRLHDSIAQSALL